MWTNLPCCLMGPHTCTGSLWTCGHAERIFMSLSPATTCCVIQAQRCMKEHSMTINCRDTNHCDTESFPKVRRWAAVIYNHRLSNKSCKRRDVRTRSGVTSNERASWLRSDFQTTFTRNMHNVCNGASIGTLNEQIDHRLTHTTTWQTWVVEQTLWN